MTEPPSEIPRSALDDASVPSAVRRVGDVLGQTYRIIRKIGAGGMADVFEVEHLRLGSHFAAKVARARGADDPSLRRFVQEAKLLSSLSSDHIVKVFDLSRPEDPVPFYVMELLQGRDLRQLIRRASGLSTARALAIVSDACRGVAVMHAAGLVHRDLKPENLFVTSRDGGAELCKLLDFGVVKAEEGNSTQQGALIGTVRYMAPEQIEHSGTVGPRSDVYGLGAILYECLAGRPPHVADTLERLFFKILNEAPPPLRSLRPEIATELDDVVLRALHRDPAVRHASALDFYEALQPFASEPEELDRTLAAPSPLPRKKPASRGDGVRWGSALLSLAGVAAIGGIVLGDPPTPRSDASRPSAQASSQPRSPAREPSGVAAEPPSRPARAEVVAPSPSPTSGAPVVSAAPAATATMPSVRRPKPAPEEPPAPAVRFAGPLIDDANPYGP